MNDTHQETRGEGPDDGFDPRRLRSVTDITRSTDDRMIGGVCAGAGRYLGLDPVVLRVIIGALTLLGFAGVILYLAAWFLLPEDDGTRSVAAQWFRLDQNEEQVRVVGLIIAVVLAIGAGSGTWGGDWTQPFPWLGLILIGGVYLAVIRPARRRHQDELLDARTTSPTDPTSVLPPRDEPDAVTQVILRKSRAAVVATPTRTRRRRSPALTLLTLSAVAIALGVLSLTHDDLAWPTYVATALGVIGLGLLVGTFVGDGGLLIAIGLILGLVLAVQSVFPTGRIGQDLFTPTSSTDVQSDYRLGIGELRLDLTGVADPAALAGRTVVIDQGVGSMTITVPKGLPVDVDAHLRVGEITIFGRTVNGTSNHLAYDGGTDVLTIDIDQRIGDITVVRG